MLTIREAALGPDHPVVFDGAAQRRELGAVRAVRVRSQVLAATTLWRSAPGRAVA